MDVSEEVVVGVVLGADVGVNLDIFAVFCFKYARLLFCCAYPPSVRCRVIITCRQCDAIYSNYVCGVLRLVWSMLHDNTPNSVLPNSKVH